MDPYTRHGEITKISNNKNAGERLIARIALLVKSKVEGSFESFFTLQTASMLQ
jgi:hypothetical protein